MNYIKQICDSLTVKEVFEHYGISVNSKYMASCFAHNDKTPSVKIYEKTKKFHCFSCLKSGSIIDFVMDYFNLDTKQAMSKINGDFGLNLPIGEELTPEQKKAFKEQKKAREEEKRKLEQKQKYSDYQWGRLKKYRFFLNDLKIDNVEIYKEIKWCDDLILFFTSKLITFDLDKNITARYKKLEKRIVILEEYKESDNEQYKNFLMDAMGIHIDKEHSDEYESRNN